MGVIIRLGIGGTVSDNEAKPRGPKLGIGGGTLRRGGREIIFGRGASGSD